MKTIRRIIVGTTALSVGLLPVAPAHATAVIAATEPTQILNNIQLLASYAKHVQAIINQATQIYNQLQAYANMVQNTKNLITTDLQNLVPTLASLKSVVSSAKGLSYAASSIASNFSATHQGFSQYAAKSVGPASFTGLYDNWSKLHNEASTTALQHLNLQEQDFASEDSTIQTISAKINTTQGAVEAITTGSELALQQINQLQLLRKLMMDQEQQQTRYAAIEQEQKDLAASQSDKITTGTPGAIGGERSF